MSACRGVNGTIFAGCIQASSLPPPHTHNYSVVVVAGDFNCSYSAIDSAYALDDPVSEMVCMLL